MTNKRRRNGKRRWRLIDLHIHTPASSDYQEPEVSYLDILHRCEARGLEIVAFTDHNTVTGYKQMYQEIEQLEMLEQLNRLQKEEQSKLKEYRRILKKILVLPAFELTATLGFHILGIFPKDKSVREIEHLLLNLNIPPDQLDIGSSTVGATTDVITAYKMIDEAGGLVIAAHANSSNGVAMRGFRFGGQTKIAYTQDPHLHALEVTDLDRKGRRSTAAFFSGKKPEYPRRMHCIQGSDAHRLRQKQQNNKKNLGVGDRSTELLLPEISFDALKELFLSNDFARTRPQWASSDEVFDFIHEAREDGSSIVQDFHESMTVRGGRLYAIISNVCALANTNGGTLYIGLNADPKKPVRGISNSKSNIAQLKKEISNRISPPLKCQVDSQKTRGKRIIRVLVPRGEDPPYAVDDNKIYVRDEADTALAVRDEIVQLVVRGRKDVKAARREKMPEPGTRVPASDGIQPPRTGVEIANVEERDGSEYFTMRDLRNGNVVKNVTRSSARRLWHYAISQYTNLPKDQTKAKVQWQGNLGILRKQRRGKRYRYDLAQRTKDGIRFYFGVTEDGIHGQWKSLIGNGVD